METLQMIAFVFFLNLIIGLGMQTTGEKPTIDTLKEFLTIQNAETKTTTEESTKTINETREEGIMKTLTDAWNWGTSTVDGLIKIGVFVGWFVGIVIGPLAILIAGTELMEYIANGELLTATFLLMITMFYTYINANLYIRVYDKFITKRPEK